MSTEMNIGPGALATPDVQGGPAFVLADPAWAAVQQYVADAKALPSTEELFRNSLGPGAPTDLSDFKKLTEAYAQIQEHCRVWNPLFNTIVELASHVYEYGTSKAPVYYPPILPLAETLEKEPGNTAAQNKLKAILELLEKEASQYASEASAVFSQVKQFAEETEADQLTLVGPKGEAGLLKYYEDKYSRTSKAVEEIVKKTEGNRQILEALEAEYRHDVIVASTTPTYAWIWPFGTVAGAVVAGIYGHKAVEVLREEERVKHEIEALENEEAADANLMTVIQFATTGVKNINKALSAALPVIQEVEGAWGAMASDLKAIAALIEDNIEKVPPIIMSLGVEAAVKAWHEVALAADTYRKHAYISAPTAAQQLWKLENQLTPPALA
jgi:hypothetical protein